MTLEQAKSILCRLVVVCLVAAGFWFLGSPSAHAQDFPGSQDHPMVSRYKGSFIDAYDMRDYDRYVLALGKPTRDAAGNRAAAKTQELEGKVTRIVYRTPQARSAFEVFRNYEMALQGAGFTTLYRCLPAECGGYYNFVIPRLDRNLKTMTKVIGFGSAGQLHYLAAKASTPTGSAYVSLLVGMDSYKKMATAVLDVIETKEMDTGMVTVNADSIGEGIDKTGHMAIYGIYFDTGSDQIKPESASTLAEITKLLSQKPALKLLVVGHTDNQGGYDMNMDLSDRRAASVVKALVAQGIASGRLRPAGVGYLSPVASNDTEDGRGKNRRVELVKQ
jgi:OOP family OmpA-OmpF porin